MDHRILVVGSVAFDSIKTVHGKADMALGGSAVYFSSAASSFAGVKVIGVVGEDFPDKCRNMLEKRGIDIAGLLTLPGKTFHWKGSYDRNFSTATTISTELNVFEKFNPVLTPEQKRCGIIFLANIDPDLQMNVLRQSSGHHLVACDTMNLWISAKRASLVRLLKKVNILFINDEEVRQLTGEYNLIKAARKCMAFGPKIVVVKKGANGASLFIGGQCISCPSYPIEDVIDPTGAGDTFAGGFLGYLSGVRNWRSVPELKRAMAYGTVMSSFAVQSFSIDGTYYLTKAKIRSRFNEYTSALRLS